MIAQEMCELDMRETEILFFLLVVIMIRSRKTGSTALVAYLRYVVWCHWMYCNGSIPLQQWLCVCQRSKHHSLLPCRPKALHGLLDPGNATGLEGHTYVLLQFALVQGMLLPEPTYKGPENITYFRANSLAEELARDTKVGSEQGIDDPPF